MPSPASQGLTTAAVLLPLSERGFGVLEMASMSSALAALFLSLNLVFFALVSASHSTPCPPPPRARTPPPPWVRPPPPPRGRPSPKIPTTPNTPSTPTTPAPNKPTPPGTPITPTTPGTPITPAPSSSGTCPRDALKLGICANVLGLVNVVVGSPPTLPCCSLLQGLVDLEAAVCLCTAIRANILGININIPLSLSLLLNVCGRGVPSGFQCS